ncbi:TIGR01777 family oxidoreductase [uncultured Ferrimonas sp.]|uniref:TIGR01777 family oxidoreductase n=1 Tax=uncultured Ferrimonas sp. TaxID=432640 RepID=UPI00261ED543|nr:TIGR01777 family oxidoreductase [uncultured Ferrimonas sp.]
MRILITGATGFIGKALVPHLTEHRLTVLSRNPNRAEHQLGSQHRYLGSLDGLNSLAEFDAVINLAGEPIAANRWDRQRKLQICHSRWDLTEQLTHLFFAADERPKIWLNASAIGYYGPRNAAPVDESAPSGNDFAASVCQRWESLANQVASHTRLAILRIGLVMHPDGGALARMLPPFKLGGGGPIGNGQQMMSWIHRDDMVAALLHLLNHNDACGVFNATAPNPVSNKVFVQALGKALHRPAVIPVPATAIKLMFGEMSTLLLTGQAVQPKALLDSGFSFAYPSIDACFQQLFAHD